MMRRIAPIILALLMFPVAGGAAPLDKAACETLKVKRSALLAEGLEGDMARGAQWARSNLSPDRLKLIEKLIEVEEQLSFRCGEIVTAQPIMKEPPKPAGGAKKKDSGSKAGQASAAPDQPQAKKKKASSAKAQPKGEEAAHAAQP